MFMKILLLTISLFACKLTSMSSSDLHDHSTAAQADDQAVFLHVLPRGIEVTVPDTSVTGALPQAFYHLRSADQKFARDAVTAQPLRAAPVTFAELVLAWQNQAYTWLCFLQDIAGSRVIEPTRDNRCYRQDAQHSYLQQFAAWCSKDNKYHAPFFLDSAAPYCKVGKISASKTVRIPLRCFTGNANLCFPPAKRSIKRAGRNPQRIPDRRFRADEYYIAKYLQKSGKTFPALLDDIYAQASDCRDGAGMEVHTFVRRHPFYCSCPRHKNKKIILNGQEKKCGATGYAYFFPPLP